MTNTETAATGLVSQSELFRQNQFLLEMWPEACRQAWEDVIFPLE